MMCSDIWEDFLMQSPTCCVPWLEYVRLWTRTNFSQKIMLTPEDIEPEAWTPKRQYNKLKQNHWFHVPDNRQWTLLLSRKLCIWSYSLLYLFMFYRCCLFLFLEAGIQFLQLLIHLLLVIFLKFQLKSKLQIKQKVTHVLHNW